MCLWELPHKPPVAGFIAAVYSIIFLVAFFWNLFIMCFFLRNKNHLKEPSSVFLFCLAMVDFLEAFSSLPFYIAALAMGEWRFGDSDEVRQRVCSAIAFFLSIFLLVSVHLLAIIAFDRCLYVVCALRYKKLLNSWSTWILVVTVNTVPVIIASTPFYGFGVFGFVPSFGACLFRWAMDRRYVLMFALEAMIPIIAIIVFTLWTYVYVRRFVRRSGRRRSQWSIRQQGAAREQKRTLRQQKTLTRLFFTLLVCQLICFTPGLLTALLGFFTNYETIPPEVLLVDFVFILLNAAMNPIVQSILKKPIRDSLHRLIKDVLKGIHLPCSKVAVSTNENSNSLSEADNKVLMTNLAKSGSYPLKSSNDEASSGKFANHCDRETFTV